MARFNNVRMKANFDQSLSDSDNIEGFTPNVGSPQKFKLGQAGMLYFGVTQREHSDGQSRFDPNGAQSFAGFQVVTYTQPACHPDAYAWLVSNYQGQVTVYLPTEGTTAARYNAFLRFEKSRREDGWYEVRYIYTLIEAL
jgi:hypothetical protein